MAIALPLLFLVVFGIFQSAFTLFCFVNASFAIRSTARYASVHSATSITPVTSSQVQSMVKSQLYLGSSISPSVSVSYLTPAFAAGGANVSGDEVQIVVSWQSSWNIPFFGPISYTVGATTCTPVLR